MNFENVSKLLTTDSNINFNTFMMVKKGEKVRIYSEIQTMQAQNNFINHIFMRIIVIDHQSIHNGMRWGFVYQFPIVNYDIFF